VFRRAQLWLLFLLAPVLAAGTPEGVYSWFYCAQMGTQQSACCCAAAQKNQAPCDRIEQGSCCDQRTLAVPGTDQDTTRHELVPSAPILISRVRLADLFVPRPSQGSFVVREAPRAIGPPLILRTQKLLI
jgi:hypothetical protein